MPSQLGPLQPKPLQPHRAQPGSASLGLPPGGLAPARRFRPGAGERLRGARRSTACAWALAGALALLSGAAFAQDSAAGDHWAFSAFFGTGWYRVSDSRSVYVLRVPPRQVLRPSTPGAGGWQAVGLELRYPLTFGLNQLDDLSGIVSADNFGTVSFTPGVELEWRVTPRWSLRPFAHFGWGRETEGGDSAWIWYGGLKSRHSLGPVDSGWNLLAALQYAGYDPRSGPTNDLALAMTGIETSRLWPALRFGGSEWAVDGHLTYSWLFEEARFPETRGLGTTVDDQWELGLALRRADGDLRWGILRFARLGLAWRWSSDGDYRAITLNLSSPFLR